MMLIIYFFLKYYLSYLFYASLTDYLFSELIHKLFIISGCLLSQHKTLN
jgi:hypothetical protein